MKNDYLDMIPDEYLGYMAQHYWGKLEQFCILLTLDTELSQQGLRN